MEKAIVSKLKSAENQVQQEDQEALIQHLRAQITEHKKIITEFQKSKGGQQELAREITASVRALEPLEPILYHPRIATQSEVGFVENLSDLHVGEFIRPEETRGMGAANYAILQKRMKVHEENLVNYLHVNRLGYNIPDLDIFGIGDYVSGDIHLELLVTNEFPLPVQIAKAADLISNHIRNLAPHFRRVRFHGVGADNHGRLVKKPQAKQKARNNASYLVHALIKSQLRDVSNFELIDYEDMAPIIEVANHKFIVTHGDTIKSVMGIPYYGFERHLAKEATRMMKRGGFDYLNIGHWHMGRFMEPLIMNSSLTGTTEYDHASGRFAKPGQISYLVHPKHGVFNFTSWKFEVEKELL